MPKLLRMPYEKIFWTFSPTSPPIMRPTRQNGLSRGASPSSSSRMITPVRCRSSGSGPPNWSSPAGGVNGPVARFCIWPRRPVSPTIAYSFPSGPKRMTPPSWLPRNARSRAQSSLEGPELDDVAGEDEPAVLPLEAVDPVAHQPHVAAAGAVGAGLALAPEQVDPAVALELRVQRDAEQAALRVRVHREVEDGVRHGAVPDPLDLAARLLEHQEVVTADEGHRRRLRQPRHRGADREVGVEHLRWRRGRLRQRRTRHRHRCEHCQREDSAHPAIKRSIEPPPDGRILRRVVLRSRGRLGSGVRHQ